MTEENKADKGLEGGLILVGFFVVTSPLRWINTIYLQLFGIISWTELTTAGYEKYNPMWKPVLIGEFIYNITLIILSLYLIYLFFSKHKLFPKIFIITLLIPPVFVLLDSWAVTLIYPNEKILDEVTLRNFFQALLFAIIFIPYTLLSKRVKETFIESKAKKQD